MSEIKVDHIFSSEREQEILREATERLDMSAEAVIRYWCRMGQLVEHRILQGYKLGWVLNGEVVNPDDHGPKMAPMPPSEAIVRSCNRHDNCDKADQEVMAKRGCTRAEIHPSFHCHDDECEDCFGS